MNMAAKTAAKSEKKPDRAFTKEAILQSERYATYRDYFYAILAEGQKYTHAQLQEKIDLLKGGK
jgi:hypothetical protein